MAPKTRRRTLIAALLIFAIATTAWLLTPRIDSRLVGHWVNVDPTKFAAQRRFDADGTHSYSSDPTAVLPRGFGSWSVSGGTLTFTARSALFPPPSSVSRWFYEIINRFRAGPTIEHYKILEANPDALRIQSHSGAPIEENRRKP